MPVLQETEHIGWVQQAMQHSVDISPGNRCVDWTMVREQTWFSVLWFGTQTTEPVEDQVSNQVTRDQIMILTATIKLVPACRFLC